MDSLIEVVELNDTLMVRARQSESTEWDHVLTIDRSQPISKGLLEDLIVKLSEALCIGYEVGYEEGQAQAESKAEEELGSRTLGEMFRGASSTSTGTSTGTNRGLKGGFIP